MSSPGIRGSVISGLNTRLIDATAKVGRRAVKQAYAPDGTRIIGTLESIPGTALILGVDDDGTPEYLGETEVFWDGQQTCTGDQGQTIWIDENGYEWATCDLTYREEGNEQ